VTEIRILALEDDPASQAALHTMLDAEDWVIQIVSDVDAMMKELARGSWGLLIAGLDVIGLSGPVFTTLLELAVAAPIEDGRSRIRVLFVIPQDLVTQAIPLLESQHVAYVVKPYQFNDFTEKINDLLVQANLITKTARERGFAFDKKQSPRAGKRASKGQSSSMFASREDYHYTDEELAEYEREQETEKKKKITNRPI
jgi:DNA-binding response OmpR family regulator